MNKYLFLSILISSCFAQAITQVQFFLAGQAMVTLLSSTPNGSTDNDAIDLFKLMNVPPQDSIMGPGKAIATENQDMNLSCGNSPRGPMCSIVFNKSARATILPSQKKISYKMIGSEAAAMAEMWTLQNDHLEFTTTDNKLELKVSPDLFQMDFVE
jgi:hypothetical protein